jgi:hypothetical protein
MQCVVMALRTSEQMQKMLLEFVSQHDAGVTPHKLTLLEQHAGERPGARKHLMFGQDFVEETHRQGFIRYISSAVHHIEHCSLMGSG